MRSSPRAPHHTSQGDSAPTQPRMGKKTKAKSDFKIPRLVETGAGTQSLYLRSCGSHGSVSLVDNAADTLLSSVPAPALARGFDSFEAPSLRPALQKKKDLTDTAGAAWGDMKAPKLTPELKRELQLVRMRGAFDPKRYAIQHCHCRSDPRKSTPAPRSPASACAARQFPAPFTLSMALPSLLSVRLLSVADC